MDKKTKYIRDGYSFSGCYSSDKEKTKQDQKKYHKDGYKAVIITEKSLARYTTGSGGKVYNTGYSLYVKKKGN